MEWRVRAGGLWQALLPGVYFSLTGAPNLLSMTRPWQVEVSLSTVDWAKSWSS